MIRFTLLLAVLSAFPPLATDMYLPALPRLQALWQQAPAVLNLTLVLFFVVYCISLLIYGPLSDRFGRKPPLMTGIAIYILGSFLCGASHSVYMLIGARVIQAFGAGSASAISMAMTKDRLAGKERERIMGYVSVIMAIAPMAAPMVGSLVLKYSSWEWIFVVQALLGMVALVGVALTPETLAAPIQVSIPRLAGNYLSTLSNKRFVGVTACTSLAGMPLFAFIAASATIYIGHFGLGETRFSLFFGGNALSFMAGSMVCTRLTRCLRSSSLVAAGFVGIALGGGLMLLQLFPAPWALALPMGVITFSLGLSRPPSNSLALEQVQAHVGAASSVLIFIYFILGALSMALVSFTGDHQLTFIGALALALGSVISLVWFRLRPHLDEPELS